MTPFRIRDGLYVRLARLLYARRFHTFGSNVRILFPLDLIGMENISNGDDVQVGHRTTLAALTLPGGDASSLSIGSGTQLGSFNHIYCTRRIWIGDNVLTANGVYISDNLHGYADPRQPILSQPLRQLADVEIGSGAWIGHNCCIIGARVGRQTVIGANAVVTRDIPDLCVAVGAPAVVIKRFDESTESWRPTNTDGSFREEGTRGPYQKGPVQTL